MSPSFFADEAKSFLDLPTELQREVGKYLNFPDLCRFTVVSKQCRALFTQEEVLSTIKKLNTDMRDAYKADRSITVLEELPGIAAHDLSQLVNCQGCVKCARVLPLYRFNTPLNLTNLNTQNYHKLGRGPAWDDKSRNQPSLMRKHGGWPCRECLSKDKELGTSGFPKGQWLMWLKELIIDCKCCEELKRYDINHRRLKKDPRYHLLPCSLQSKRGYCHECWTQHKDWTKGHSVVESRIEDLDIVVAAALGEKRQLEAYSEWMHRAVVDSNSLQQEPVRTCDTLMKLPLWVHETAPSKTAAS